MTVQTLEVEEGRKFSCDPWVAARLRALLPGYYEERDGQSVISRLVGLLQLNRTTQLRVRSPKATGSQLLTWQAFVDPSLRTLQKVGIASPAGQKGELEELLALTFCRLFLQTVGRHGLSRAYLRRQQVGSELVGRIDFARLARSGGNLTLLPCTVWRRLPDTPWNQLIAGAVRKIRRHPGLRAACQAELASCETLLESVGPYRARSYHNDELPRTALPFAPVCALARMILENAGLDEGRELGLTFLINLEQLFEKTVVKAFQDAGVRCLAKQPLPYRRDGHGASFQMDLFCPDFRGEPLVVDAKFKTKVSNSNLQQMVTYCVMTGARRALLVLPTNEAVAERSFTVPTVHGPIAIDVATLEVANRSLAEWHQSSAGFVRALEGRHRQMFTPRS
jgi:5-methylcytosine-specific restriction endonuclease McrBC regulatory subunit McrC